jgi:hypothetical protein
LACGERTRAPPDVFLSRFGGSAMKLRLLGSTLLVGGLLVLVGCNRESPRGGPGAEKANKGEKTSTSTASSTSPDRADTFTIKVPSGNTNVTQGEQKEVTVTLSRGSKFDEDVKLAFKAPNGIQVTPPDTMAKKGGDEIRVTVKAMPDAPVGTTNIEVTGTPTHGSATKVEMAVEIKKKS